MVVREPRAAAPEAVPLGAGGPRSRTLAQALATPGFWVFALGVSFYGLIAAGTALFNESILRERGFGQAQYLTVLSVGPLIGLAANLLGGAAATLVRPGLLMGGALLVQAVALAAFPRVATLTGLYAYVGAMGLSGGVLTVVFF